MIILRLPSAQYSDLVVTPYNEQDLYMLSLVIKPGDHVRTKSSRKISAGESKSAFRKTAIIYIEVVSVSYRYQDLELVLYGKVTHSTEKDIQNSSSHSLHIYEYSKVRITPHEELPSVILDDLKKLTDLSASAYQIMVLITRDGTAKIAYMDESQFFKVSRLSTTIPQKNVMNQSRVYSQYQKFYARVASYLKQSVTNRKVNKIYILGQQDLLDSIKKVIEDVKLDGVHLIYQTTKTNSFGQAFLGLSKSYQVECYIFDNFKRNLANDENYFVGISAIQCLYQQLCAVDEVMLVKSLLVGENRAEIEQCVKGIYASKDGRAKLVMVSDNSEMGQRLQSYGGIIVNTRYAVYVDHEDNRIGEEFTEWWDFAPLES